MIIPIAALLLFPLLGFVINFFIGYKLPKGLVGIIGCGAILVPLIISIYALTQVLSGAVVQSVYNYFPWIHAGSLNLDFSFLLDRLSVLMLLIITGVGFLIHVYSVGYMHEDEGYSRFFSYLNLFVFFMQMLVMGANFVVTFIGWEGVGLCSYLLIGFWFRNQNYNDAAKKAFIMNRIGDLGFILGMFFIFNFFGSLNYTEVFSTAQNSLISKNFNDPNLIWITILLFIGATGKSAQIPLYTWLPDAMAGPTPVSALIHAATMVTAGIYLIVRSHILYILAPFTLDIITVIGLATAFFAATIGLAQNDIKKVLAYSTVSQLGYMFVALGIGAFGSGMFHLLTHAFFKALLFLGAGSVIHAMGGEQDIRLMGGLRKKLPITFITFFIGTLAISGIPPFAGFFSKDEILAHAFEKNIVVYGVGVLTSLITAVYMFRVLYMTFFGEFRGTAHQREHLHESPASMTFPLIILAILSAIGGFLGIPEFTGIPHALGEYFKPVFADIASVQGEGHAMSTGMEVALMAVAVVLAVVAWIYARSRYAYKGSAEPLMTEPTGFAKVLANKYYVDELYDNVIVRPLHALSAAIYRFLENGLIDGLVNGTGRFVTWSGRYVRRVQTGNIGYYIFAMVFAIIILLYVTQIVW